MKPTSIAAAQLKRASIILPAAPTAAERSASRELSDAIQGMTGVKLAARSSARSDGDPLRFVIGNAAEGAGGGSALEEDEVEILRPDDRTVVFRGGGPGGVLYAVYEWLDQLGCRWFHPEVTRLPGRQSLILPDAMRRKPSFEYRETIWISSRDPQWAARNRLNGHHHPIPRRLGGHWVWDPYVHSFDSIIPPAEHGKRHPEFFADRPGAGRQPHGTQWCLTNPRVLELATQFVLERMARPDVRIVDVSQNDNCNFCHCPACQAIHRQTGSPSGAIIQFVNAIAAVTSRQYQDKFVGTLAYNYSQPPPRGLAVHDNVIVRLCHMAPSCDVHPLADCPHNRRYAGHLEQWRRIARRVYVWHYVTNFMHCWLLHPNFDALAADIRYYRDQGVAGIFFQGYDRHGVSMAPLHAYAQARLAWDASRDYFAEAAEFANAYYGPAGGDVMKLIDVLHQRARQGFHADLYTHPHEGLYTSQQMQQAAELYQQAMRKSGDDPALIKRMDMLGLWLNYTRIMSESGIEKRRGCFRITAAPDAPRLYDQIRKDRTRLNARFLVEHLFGFQQLDTRLRYWRESRELPIRTLSNERWEAQVCPGLAGMLCSFRSLDDGRNVLAAPVPWLNRYPTFGGYTEGARYNRWDEGFLCSYRVVEEETGPQSLVITAQLGQGVSVKRVFRLTDDRLEVETTYCNGGRRAVAAQPLRNLLVSLGDVDRLVVVRGHSGGGERLPMPAPQATAGDENLSLQDDRRPAGWWGCFSELNKVGLIEEFSAGEPVACRVNAMQRDRLVLLTTVLPGRRLAPGGRLRLVHRYQIIHRLPSVHCPGDAGAQPEVVIQ